jgi:thioesterase domain-containing protein
MPPVSRGYSEARGPNLATVELLGARDWPLLPLQPYGSKATLFLIPGIYIPQDSDPVDAPFFLYLRYLRALGGDRPFIGLRTLGVGSRIESFGTIEELGRSYAASVLAACPQGRILLQGDCIGGLVAFEIARILAGQGIDHRLFMSNTCCPRPRYKQLVRTMLKSEKARKREGFERIKRNYFRLADNFPNVPEMAHQLRASLRSYRDYRNSRLFFNRREVDRQRTFMFESALAYQPKPYDGDLFLVTSDDPANFGEDRGWRALVRGRVSTRHYPGDHSSIYQKNFSEVVRFVNEIDDGF